MQLLDGKKVFSPTEVNYFAKTTLEEMDFWVEGEVSECAQMHPYDLFKITLKDEKTILPCIVEGYVIKDTPSDLIGKRVTIYGTLSLFEKWGRYQFRIFQLLPSGEGIFQKNLEELIKKLMVEGLFDEKHKKPIPEYPLQLCVVTSEGSAAFTDFKRHTIEKFPILELHTADVRVQGQAAIPNLLKALLAVDKKDFDIVVITRGGGSQEDLAAFNSEAVARAIFKMKTPTIVAIGHEHNQSLAEWVADKRASTPTDAANIVTLGYQNLLEKLQSYDRYLRSKLDHTIFANVQNLSFLHDKLKTARDMFVELPTKLEQYDLLMRRTMQTRLQNENLRLESLNVSLRLLSPENTLKRGYAIATSESGQVLRSVNDVVVGQTLGVKLSDGQLRGIVRSKTKNDKTN